MRRSWIWAAVALLLLLGLTAGISLAQEKDLYWDRFDVDITILPNGDFQVVEYQQIVFIGGTFSQGYRNIPLDRVDQITDVEVWEGNTRYTQSRSNQPGTYEVLEESGQLVVNWYFEPTSDTTRGWALRYTVKGGLRIYEGGDQLFWKAIYADRSKPVRSATVVVHLPAPVSEDQLVVASYGSDAVWELKDPQTVVFTATREIPAYNGLEVRVQFPHGLVTAKKPAWQAADITPKLGSPALSISGADGRLFGDAYAGKENTIKIVVRNTGDAAAEKVKMSSSEPSGWTVSFDPEEIASIPAGEQAEVKMTIKPADKAIAGDYMVSITAKPEQESSKSVDFRITVRTSTPWGVVGVALIAVAVGVVAIAVLRFGRR